MTSTEKKSNFSLIAAIIYAVIAVYTIISKIVYVKNSEYAYIPAMNIIYWIVLIGLAVTLFTKNKRAVVFAAGVNALVALFRAWTLFDFLAYASFVAIIMLAISGNAAAKKFWFIAGALLFVGAMIRWIQGGYFKIFSTTWKSILVEIAEVVALVFAGMWLKDDTAPIAYAPVNEYATFNPQTYSCKCSSNDAIGGADKLKLYRELLDSGTITQEEFDAKKKQILGL